jgi:Arc/MetJ-type ribon-helix-helix transcriptional regulator
MANTERFSVSVGKDRASRIRALVDKGAYSSVSSAFDAAATALIEREEAKDAWWEETLRRCDEAEEHPERLLDADTFFRKVREEIERRKRILHAQ